ncbi:MAG: PilZ domain-containing protein [Phycisphaeraceae bacterium]|nr:PilZ domain-containing protein [Phycisphaeraceae bacterium]MCW5753646.1 PilZ domain-containing protein [Phycisphaeraceae bacterium]
MSALALADVGANEPVEVKLKFDRRSSPRIPADGFAMIAFGDQTDHVLIPVMLRDISHGGLGVDAHRAVEPGTPFVMYANGAPCPHHQGEVARCVSQGGKSFRLGLCTTPLLAA